MSATTTETTMNAAADTTEAEARVAPSPNPLVGTWVAPGNGIIKLVLEDSGGTLLVRAFGACVPTPCDWGQVKGHTYSDSVSSKVATAFTAQYDHGFKTAIVAGYLRRGALVVDSYNAFAPGDTRFDYHSKAIFHRV